MTETPKTSGHSDEDPLDSIKFDVPVIEGEIVDDHEDQTAEMDAATRELFYKALSLMLSLPNMVRVARGGEALQSLQLDQYGEISRAASDQACDRMAESEALANWLGPLDQIVRDYGAILALGVVMGSNVAAEIDAQNKAKDEADAKEKGEATNG